MAWPPAGSGPNRDSSRHPYRYLRREFGKRHRRLRDFGDRQRLARVKASAVHLALRRQEPAVEGSRTGSATSAWTSSLPTAADSVTSTTLRLASARAVQEIMARLVVDGRRRSPLEAA